MLAQRVHPVQSRQLCASKEGLVYSETENHVGQCQHSSLNISNHKAMVHKVVQRVPEKSKSCTIPAAAVAVEQQLGTVCCFPELLKLLKIFLCVST